VRRHGQPTNAMSSASSSSSAAAARAFAAPVASKKTLAKKAKAPSRLDAARTQLAGGGAHKKAPVAAAKAAVRDAVRDRPAAGRVQKASRAAEPMPPPRRKPHRFLPGTVALREIKRYRGTMTKLHKDNTRLLLRRLSFERWVREMAQGLESRLAETSGVRFAAGALLAIQTIAESMMVELYESANHIAVHAKRIGMNEHDVRLAVKLTMPTLGHTAPGIAGLDSMVPLVSSVKSTGVPV